MTNGPVDGYTVDELVGAYGTMKDLVQAPGLSQDEGGLLDTVIEHLEGADSASITELRRGGFATLAASDQAARDADALQYELRSGPCVDAIVEGCIFTPIELMEDSNISTRRRSCRKI